MSRSHTTSATLGDGSSTVDKTEVVFVGSAGSSDRKANSTGFSGKQKGEATFATEGLGKDHFRPVATYEGIHRYDPDFDWELKEEKKVVRKVSEYQNLRLELN